ncbi:MAG: LytTR family transcriptional regulator DNA-binding domain-containing protein [Xanthomonadales bacterium]|nr:LytTR family transcriptional regulator DNA-binding domain-containing protein [Xanthomonadales bacterium]
MTGFIRHRLNSGSGLAQAMSRLLKPFESRPELDRPASTDTADAQTRQPTFLTDQLPQFLGKQLLAVSSEGESLRVRTSRGDLLIPGCFSRALEEDLSHRRGIQIHRSHWVSLDPVPELLKMSGQWYCVVDDGTRLPISRRRRSQVRRLLGNQWNPAAPVSENPRLLGHS